MQQVPHNWRLWSHDQSKGGWLWFSMPNGMAIFWRGPPNGGGDAECKGVWKNHDLRPISGFISEQMQDRAIITMECEYETAPILNDLEWHITKISWYYLTSNNSKTVQGQDLSNGAIFNNLEQPQFSRFDVEYLIRLKIRLLWKTNRKLHPIFRMVLVWMTLSDLWPRFQGHYITQSRSRLFNVK